jgi:ribonuclease HI
MSLSTEITAYTDGSLMKKGKEIYCGYGIYFLDNVYKSISRKFTHTPITNNRAELYAILKAIIITNIIDNERKLTNGPRINKLTIYSDSEYSVKTYNEWLPKWLKTKKEYLNPDIINETLDHMKNASFKIVLIHIRAHTGKKDPHSIANEIVDDLAKKGAMKNN